MELIRTEASIKALKNKKNATIVDALNVFWDLCQDIKKHEGTLIHKLPIGDENSVVNRLIWGSNQLQKIAKYNENTVGYEAQKERLASLERDAKELEEKVSASGDVIAIYESKKAQLEQKRNDEKVRYNKQQKLEKECMELEEEIHSFGENKIPQLEQRQVQEKNRLSLFMEQYETLLKEVDKLQAQVDEQSALVANLEEKYNILSKEKSEKEAQIQDLQNSIAMLQITIEGLKEKYEKRVKEYEYYKASVKEYEEIKLPQIKKELDEVEQILSKYMSQFYEISSKVSVIKKEIAEIQERIENLIKEEQELLKEKESLQKTVAEYITTIEEDKRVIEDTRASIEKYESEIAFYEKEIETVKKRCEEASNELQSLLQRYKLLDEQKQCAESECIQWRAKVLSMETECNEKEKEMNKQKELFEQLEQKKKELEDTIKKLGEQQQTLIQDIRLLEEALRKSSVDELRKEKEVKEKQLEDLKQEGVKLNLTIQTYNENITDRENEKRNLSDNLNKKKELLSTREIEISSLRSEKEEWERKLQTLQKEMEALQLWFRSRYNSDDKKRMDNYETRIQFLKEAQQAWREEVYLIHQFANQNVRAIFNKFSDDYEAYHQTLMQVEEVLNNYQQTYSIVTRALYSEQKGNEII